MTAPPPATHTPSRGTPALLHCRRCRQAAMLCHTTQAVSYLCGLRSALGPQITQLFTQWHRCAMARRCNVLTRSRRRGSAQPAHSPTQSVVQNVDARSAGCGCSCGVSWGWRRRPTCGHFPLLTSVCETRCAFDCGMLHTRGIPSACSGRPNGRSASRVTLHAQEACNIFCLLASVVQASR